MFQHRFLQPGELPRTRAAVFWTDTPGAIPTRWGTLHCTDRRLILTTPRLSRLVSVALWPVVGVIGLIAAGLPGLLAAAVCLLAVQILLPRRVVRTLALGSVSRCRLLHARGFGKLVQRDVVEVMTVTPDAPLPSAIIWRLSASGRQERRADSVAQALRDAGLYVDDE